MANRMVRGAVFQGETFVKFVSGPPEQINLNQVNGADDWRPVDVTTLTAASVPSRGAIARDELYDNPYV